MDYLWSPAWKQCKILTYTNYTYIRLEKSGNQRGLKKHDTLLHSRTPVPWSSWIVSRTRMLCEFRILGRRVGVPGIDEKTQQKWRWKKNTKKTSGVFLPNCHLWRAFLPQVRTCFWTIDFCCPLRIGIPEFKEIPQPNFKNIEKSMEI